MMCTIIWLALCCWDFTEGSDTPTRIVGGTLTTIDQYPATAAILLSDDKDVIHICGGVIVNERHILTAAHCFASALVVDPKRYLVRVGSSLSHSGGSLHHMNSVVLHPDWDITTINNDVAIMRTKSDIQYGRTVQPATIAEADHKLADNESLQAVGWGVTTENGIASEQLRQVTVLSINLDICKDRYKNEGLLVTKNMVCTGYIDVGGRDQCTGDSGSPVFHHDTVVGLSSMGVGCARAYYPGINVRVSRYSDWIRSMVQNKPLELKPIFQFNFHFIFF